MVRQLRPGLGVALLSRGTAVADAQRRCGATPPQATSGVTAAAAVPDILLPWMAAKSLGVCFASACAGAKSVAAAECLHGALLSPWGHPP